MISNRLVVIAICAALGIATAGQSDSAFAKNKKAPPPDSAAAWAAYDGPNNHGYPNGRPFLAIEQDFNEVKNRIAAVKADTETILHKLYIIRADIGDIKDDVATLKNTLDVQVSVAPASDEQRNEDNDAPVQLFVQVTKNGVGVTGLTAAAFAYSNSFPLNGAGYCGSACFIAGENGLYALELQGDWVAASYAGTLNVQFTTSTSEGDVTSTGTSLVSFDIPAAPAP
jgi:hypothetical protein